MFVNDRDQWKNGIDKMIQTNVLYDHNTFIVKVKNFNTFS